MFVVGYYNITELLSKLRSYHFFKTKSRLLYHIKGLLVLNDIFHGKLKQCVCKQKG